MTLVLTASCAQAQFRDALNKAKEKVAAVTQEQALSQEEIGQGLKEALDNGVADAVASLSKPDGFLLSPYKILLPPEARKVAAKLRVVPGFENVEQDLVEKMNRAAESAAEKAKPIFLDAIRNMSFRDAMDILLGEQDAATNYLRQNTYKGLYSEFLPVIQASLDEVNAREYWRKAVTAYNKIPFVEKSNPALDDHVNTMALEGLFSLITEKEKGIRSNVNLRNTDLLRRVFAKQDN
ncbi:MAG: hypothetical protein RLY31_3149 [Bacteroidota bacterium]|jgi:hypothetical protein